MQRDSIASDAEFAAFLRTFLERDQRHVWMGVASARCETIRKLSLFDRTPAGKTFCVYDTAEKHNPAHAEICETRNIEEADAVELRRKLFSAFGDGQVADRQSFRQGALWNALPAELQARIP